MELYEVYRSFWSEMTSSILSLPIHEHGHALSLSTGDMMFPFEYVHVVSCINRFFHYQYFWNKPNLVIMNHIFIHLLLF